MSRFELASDFIINDTLKPHVGKNFRIANPGQPLHICPQTGRKIYPRILTVGSGNGVQEPRIFAKLMSMTGMDKPNVVYIGTPFFDRDDKYESGTEAFRKAGCTIKRLMVAKECTTPSPEEMRRIIVDWANLIVVSGGNSLFAMLRWQSIGLDLLLKDAALKETVLCGGSAGCGCWFDSMQTDSLKPEACKYGEKVLENLPAEQRLDWSFTRISCLGLGPNAFCVPHVDTVGTNNIARVDIAKRMLLENNDPSAPIYGLGVDEKAAVVYEEGKVTIMSAGARKTGTGKATCHIMYATDRNEVMCIPLIPDTGESWTFEEMIDRAIRSVDAVMSPFDLIVSEEVTNACHRRGCSGNIDMIAAIDDAGAVSVTATATMGRLERPLSIRNLSPFLELVSNDSDEADRTTQQLSSPPIPLRGLMHSMPPLTAHSRSQSIDGMLAAIKDLRLGLPPLFEGKRLVVPEPLVMNASN